MPLTQHTQQSPFGNIPTGASTTPANTSHFFTGTQKKVQPPAQKPATNLFEGLDSGLQQSGAMGQQVGSNVMGMLDGSSFDDSRTQQRETLQRAAQNLRAQSGEQTSHLLGQGAANRSQQGTEQNILQGLADNELNTNIAQQEMQERGVKTAMDLANSQQQKNVQDQDLQMRRDELYGYTDPQGNHVMGARDLAQQMFNFEVDVTGKKLDLAERQMLEQVRQFDTELDWRQKAKEMDLDEAETHRLWATSEAAMDRVFQTKMQQIEHEFAEKGWDYQFLMQNLENVHPDIVADMIDSIGTERGLWEEGEHKAIGEAEVARMETITSNTLTEDVSKTTKLSQGDYAILKERFPELTESNPEIVADAMPSSITEYHINKRWNLNRDAIDWAKRNKGKLIEIDEKHYRVGGYAAEHGGRGSSGYIELFDLETGRVVRKGAPTRSTSHSAKTTEFR